MGMNEQQKSDAVLGAQAFIVDDKTGNTVQYADGTSRGVMTKIGSITRSNTTDTTLFQLPIGAIPVSLYFWVPVASNAGTTATISVGVTGTDTFFLSGQDVKGTSGQQRVSTVTNMFAAVSTSAVTNVVAKYAETGTASSTGGPFTVAIDFYVP